MRPFAPFAFPAMVMATLPVCVAADLSPATGEMNLLALSTDEFLSEILYRQPKHLADDIAPSGAVSSVNIRFDNHQGTEWFIEQQRGGGDLVQAGVVLKNDNLVAEGIRVINWGFAHQGPGGDFPGTGDPLHSTSFFVETAACAALLLQQSNNPAYQTQIAQWTPKIKAAARWMIRPDVAGKGREKNLLPYTHRFYLRAAALGLAAAVTGDNELSQAALTYAREAVARQQPDGVNPEKDGFDVSYQMVGVSFALRYVTVCPDLALRGKLKEMSRKAIDNALLMVAPNGAVSLEGSDRAGHEKSRTGKVKTLDYKSFLQTLIFGDKLLHEPRYRTTARLVAGEHRWLAGR